MVEIIKAYGPWLLVGVVMIFMMRRGGHSGHNGGGHEMPDPPRLTPAK